jgi:hypothetical protein
MTTAQTSALTLGGALRRFMAHPSPQLLVPLVAAVWTVRLLMGGWATGDVIVPVVVLVLEPFTEWAIHVFLLHWKPRRVLGRKLDPLAARKHRAHHRDPRDEALVFVPLGFLVTSVSVGALLFLLLLPSLRLAVTVMAVSYTMLLAYEWTHFLIHSTYRPRTRFYRYVWRAHRLHHFRNENYWFGVTMHAADHVLRTFPDKDAVPVSPTARTLGVAS